MILCFEVDMCNVLDKQIETPFGTVLLYDGYTEDGTRVHVVADHIECPTVWRNAIVLGINHIEVEEWK
jgi:hypothetical protein